MKTTKHKTKAKSKAKGRTKLKPKLKQITQIGDRVGAALAGQTPIEDLSIVRADRLHLFRKIGNVRCDLVDLQKSLKGLLADVDCYLEDLDADFFSDEVECPF